MANFRTRRAARPAVPVEYPLDTFLQWAAFYSRELGFVSRKDAKDQGVHSTAERAFAAVHGQAISLSITPQDRRLADDAAAWARGMDPDNDYARQLQEVADSGVVTPHTYGVAGSLIHAYQRAMEDKARLKTSNNEWVGKEGDLWEGDFFVDEVKPFAGRRGACWLVKGRSGCSNRAVAFFLNDITDVHLSVGKKVYVRGQIKTCGEFRGRKETTLTRVKVI